MKAIWTNLVEIFDKWSTDKAPKLGAALSYYTTFSLAPLLVIAIALAGFIFGADAAQGKIVYELQSLIGKEGALVVQTAIKKSSNFHTGVIASILSIATLILTATAVLVELQDSLNIIWRVRTKPGRAIKEYLRSRLISFAMVLVIGFLLLVSLIISTAINALSNYVGTFFSIPIPVLQILNLFISLFVIFILFALIFKVLPDVELSWKDVRIGALVTTILFLIGRYLIGLYLGNSSISSTYGAAGSLAVLLVWIYYSAQILFLGAEFTYIYTNKWGSGTKPSKHAVVVKTVTVEENSTNI